MYLMIVSYASIELVEGYPPFDGHNRVLGYAAMFTGHTTHTLSLSNNKS